MSKQKYYVILDSGCYYTISKTLLDVIMHSNNTSIILVSEHKHLTNAMEEAAAKRIQTNIVFTQ